MKKIGKLSFLDLVEQKNALSPAEMKAILGGDGTTTPPNDDYLCVFKSMSFVASQYGSGSTSTTYQESYVELYGQSKLDAGIIMTSHANRIIADNFKNRLWIKIL